MILIFPDRSIGVTDVKKDTYEITVRVWVKNDDNAIVQDKMNEHVYNALEDRGIYNKPIANVRIIPEN